MITRRRITKFIYCASMVAFCPAFLAAQSSDVPHTISYQGLVTQSSGVPIIDGDQVMTFTLYSDSIGTKSVWSSKQNVHTSQGIFNVILGGNNLLIPTPMNVQLWLGTRIGEDPEMRPITKLASAPYALGIVDNAVSTTKIQNGAVATAKLKDSAVTAPKMGIDYVGHVTVNAKLFSTSRGKDIDISVGPNLSMTTTKDSAENIHLTIDGPAGVGVPTGALVAFSDVGVHAGYTYTGSSVGIGAQVNEMAEFPPNPHRNAFALAPANGKLYAIGGQASPATALVQEFDPSRNTWTTMTPMPSAHWNSGAATMNGKIYVFGGDANANPSSALYEFDPTAGTGGGWTTRASMNTARYTCGAAVLNGKLYAVGGGTPNGAAGLEEFDPAAGANGTWTTKQAPTQILGSNAVAINGKILALGCGVDSRGVQEYDPSTGAWTAKTSSPIGFNYIFSAAVLNNKVYLIYYSYSTSIWEYDPALGSGGTWSNRDALPGSEAPEVVAIGTKLYIMPGSHYGTMEYTPPTDYYYFTKN